MVDIHLLPGKNTNWFELNVVVMFLNILVKGIQCYYLAILYLSDLTSINYVECSARIRLVHHYLYICGKTLIL